MLLSMHTTASGTIEFMPNLISSAVNDTGAAINCITLAESGTLAQGAVRRSSTTCAKRASSSWIFRLAPQRSVAAHTALSACPHEIGRRQGSQRAVAGLLHRRTRRVARLEARDAACRAVSHLFSCSRANRAGGNSFVNRIVVHGPPLELNGFKPSSSCRFSDSRGNIGYILRLAPLAGRGPR